MSASEATAPVEGSAQPTRRSPGDVSKNHLNKSPQGAGDPRGEFVQFREKFGRGHEGNTGAAPKAFRKRWNALSSTRWEFDWASRFPIVFGAVTDAKQRPGFPADPPCPGSLLGVRR